MKSLTRPRVKEFKEKLAALEQKKKQGLKSSYAESQNQVSSFFYDLRRSFSSGD